MFDIALDRGPVDVRLRDPLTREIVGRWRFDGGRVLNIDFLGTEMCTVDGNPASEADLPADFVAWPRLTFEVNGKPVELVSDDPEVLRRHYSRPHHQEVSYTSPDPWLVAFHRARVAQARRLLSGVQGRLLDAGSGLSLVRQTGLTSFQLVACDRDEEAIAALVKDGIEAVVAPAEAPPFQPRSFDGLYAGEIIEHLADPDAALRAWVSLVRPGGRLVITTPNRRHMMVRASRREVVQNPEHLFEYSPQDFRAAVERAGARVVRHEGLSLPLPIYVPRRGWRDAVRVSERRLPVPTALLERYMRVGRWLPRLCENQAIVAMVPKAR